MGLLPLDIGIALHNIMKPKVSNKIFFHTALQVSKHGSGTKCSVSYGCKRISVRQGSVSAPSWDHRTWRRKWAHAPPYGLFFCFRRISMEDINRVGGPVINHSADGRNWWRWMRWPETDGELPRDLWPATCSSSFPPSQHWLSSNLFA